MTIIAFSLPFQKYVFGMSNINQSNHADQFDNHDDEEIEIFLCRSNSIRNNGKKSQFEPKETIKKNENDREKNEIPESICQMILMTNLAKISLSSLPKNIFDY